MVGPGGILSHNDFQGLAFSNGQGSLNPPPCNHNAYSDFSRPENLSAPDPLPATVPDRAQRKLPRDDLKPTHPSAVRALSSVEELLKPPAYNLGAVRRGAIVEVVPEARHDRRRQRPRRSLVLEQHARWDFLLEQRAPPGVALFGVTRRTAASAATPADAWLTAWGTRTFRRCLRRER